MVVIAAADSQEAGSTVVTEDQKSAEVLDEPLSIVHVLNQSRFQELEQTSLDETGRTIEVQTIREIAEKITDALPSATLTTNYTAVNLVGSLAEEVLKYGTREDASFLIIGGRKRSKIGKVLFSSVTRSILLSAELPVLTVRDDND